MRDQVRDGVTMIICIKVSPQKIIAQAYYEVKNNSTHALPSLPTVNVKGTIFEFDSKKSHNKMHTVFIPDYVAGGQNKEIYCQSDFAMHTAFLLRC